MKFVDPKTDIAFKKIFGSEDHKEILLEFLNNILELEYAITEVTLLNPYQAPKLSGLKESALDIKAKDQKGHEFIIEMQVEKETAFYKRSIYYTSKAYIQQLDIGDRYHLLKPVIFLGILDFTVFANDCAYSRHLILNLANQSHDLTDLEFNFVELPKFTKQEHELSSISDKWLYFLKQANNLDQVPEHADTEALKNAYAIANQHGWNREEFDLYIYQGIQIGKVKNSVETARLEGMEKGMKQGMEKGIEQGIALERQNTARLLAQQQLMVSNLLKTLPIEQVAVITGLSITDIQALL